MSKIGKERVVEIITRTFDKNPSVNSVIGEHGNRKRKLARLANYAYYKSKNRDGLFVSENGRGAALCFMSTSNPKMNWNEMFAEFRFAVSLPINKVFQALRRESYLKKHRLQSDHLYFWFFGVENNGGRAAFELKDVIFKIAEKNNLPILLETSVARNKLIYERYGFEVYHEWVDENGTLLWFMCKSAPMIENLKNG